MGRNEVMKIARLALIPIGGLILVSLFLLTGQRKRSIPASSPAAWGSGRPSDESGDLFPSNGAQPSGSAEKHVDPSMSRSLDPGTVFHCVRSRYKAASNRWARKPDDPIEYSGFPMLERLHQTDVRLWALAFPDYSARLSLQLLGDPASDKQDQRFALYALSVLLQEGHSEVASGIIQAAKFRNSAVSEMAIQTLAEFGKLDLCRDVMVAAAFQGNIAAIQSLDREGSIENLSRLQTLCDFIEKSEIPEMEYARDPALTALERARLLANPNWQQSLLNIIANKDTEHSHWLPWVLKILETTKVEGSDQALQDYLLRSENRETEIIRSRPGFDSTRDPMDELIASSELSDHQSLYDDVLLVYSRLGGKLSSVQKARLEYFGMLGDPKELLQVYLNRKSIWDAQ